MSLAPAPLVANSISFRNASPVHRRHIHLIMRRSLLVSAAVAGFAIVSAKCAASDRTSRFPSDLRPAVSAALDSFANGRADGRNWAALSATRQGDTVVVLLIQPEGLRDPGSWDGPRLSVWVVGRRQIVRSAVETGGG